ncbi:uncharacterized protein K452DRAFT_223923 [Aplosporella prunicola CBS 121167]|uniref:Uncharacterized protein n=1 Tax=Aplosporella prunicola CBS 121167 TaxID=1176127 RepID=A0A6A6BMN3_9PEZI|nr:uncharacterized protein K452DRAFT_223923 [Aplosporella prunicola CBS 121167]KAF2144087.1 hypothetical protein K452DRAFT_223923 [Aplosporella prunicola CBS 121167]
MAYYENAPWSAPGRQPSWETPAPPSRSGTSSTVQREEPTAFGSQIEEVERAIDNLYKSGKMPMFGVNPMMGPRRDSMPPTVGGRAYGEFDPRMAGGQRHHSVSDYDGIRSHSAQNLQGFYANQRFAPRPNDADQMMQAKRRMAAQRERELRNYHQEQQYNRNISGAKSDRSMSPNAMSEEDRRELIARQHRALYGDGSAIYEGGNRTSSQDVRVATTLAGRNSSPLAFDPFGMQGKIGSQGDSSVQMPARDGKDANAGAQRSRANSTSSPSSNPTGSFSLFETAQQSSRTSTSSPTGASPPRQSIIAPGAGVAPIGTRPAQGVAQAANPALSKRSTTPLPSPLSFGFTATDAAMHSANERSGSTSSNPTSSVADKGVSLSGWGSNSAVWGTASKNTLGVQASVWG